MGPKKWMKTSAKLININQMRGEAFKLVAQLQAKIEDCAEDWHLAPMWGHSWTHKLFPFYLANIVTLQVHQINMVFQIFDTHIRGGVDNSISLMLMNDLQAFPL